MEELLKFLEELGDGSVMVDLDESLREVAAAAANTGKPGTVTITLTITPRRRDEALEFTGKVAGKAPKHDPVPSLFFLTENGFSRDNPKQGELFTENLRQPRLGVSDGE
jgi:hypothetical protein